MIRFLKAILILSGISYFCFFSQPVLAGSQVLTNVKVIHASTGPEYVDPSLKKIIPELKSVFKYTSYRLLKNQSLALNFNKKGRVELPGKRTLIVMPTNVDGKRISYQITIRKNNDTILQTRARLKNNNSFTIGGPQFNNGYLLFNISGSLQ